MSLDMSVSAMDSKTREITKSWFGGPSGAPGRRI